MQFLIDILRVREDLQGSTEELRLVVVDTCLEVRKMAREKIRNVDNLLHPKEIEPFSNKELRNYIEESPVPRNLLLGVMSEYLGDELIECLWKLTGGHPAFINAYLCSRDFYAEYSFSGNKHKLREDIFSVFQGTNDSEYLKHVSTEFWKTCLRHSLLDLPFVEMVVKIAGECQVRCLNAENLLSVTCPYPSFKRSHFRYDVENPFLKMNDFCSFFSPWVIRSVLEEEL
jgi:hypothetical protein